MSADNRKVILFLTSSPTGKNPLDFGKELRKIQKALDSSVDRNNYDIRIRPGILKNELMHLLDDQKPDYLHITMHASKTDGLDFEDDNGKPLPMSAAEFAQVLQLLNKQHQPHVIILSACNSKAHAEAVKAFCKYSIGTVTVFPEDAGVVYAQRFYEILFNKNSTDIPYCHQAAVLGIQQNVPPFEAVDGIAVHEIPVLITI